jgi:DNA replication protein DnaC
MRALMDSSNIPLACRHPIKLIPDDCDIKAFNELADIKEDIKGYVEQGSSFYIFSKTTGNGKTSWAIKMLLKYFDSVWAGNGFRCRGVFIHIPTFLTRLKNFRMEDYEFEELKKHLLTADLVVFDDIASTDMSSYDNSQLLSYIDHRVLENKSNIYTGNVGKDDIEKALGKRLSSRIWNNSKVITLAGRDKR